MREFHDGSSLSVDNEEELTRRKWVRTPPNNTDGDSQSSSNTWRERVTEGLARFLALSAAVDYQDLQHKRDDGRYQFSRGRYKYYGLGSLVIFFAFFSAYGMGHMLSTMADMTWYGACIAGLVWGVFQWCLERQMLISIQTDAVWWKKAIGLIWRSGLALMSASVMVYPFFVQSNRAEIDVRIGEITQHRLLETKTSSEAIADLPRLQQTASEQQQSMAQLEKASVSAAPDIAVFQQRAKLCWQRFQKSEKDWDAQVRELRRSNQTVTDSVLPQTSSSAKITAIIEKKTLAREQCQLAENAVNKRNAEWRQQKTRELNAVQTQYQTTLDNSQQAQKKRATLFDAQAERVQQSARSGFAADFFAVAQMVIDDPYRRFQLLWWLSWFLAIEMVAILIKFGTSSDLDMHLQLQEKATLMQLEKEAKLQQEAQTSDYLRRLVQFQAEQAYWEKQAPERLAQAVQDECEADAALRAEIRRLQRQCGRSVAMLEAALLELERLDALTQKAKARGMENGEVRPNPSMHRLCELAETDLQKRLGDALTAT